MTPAEELIDFIARHGGRLSYGPDYYPGMLNLRNLKFLQARIEIGGRIWTASAEVDDRLRESPLAVASEVILRQLKEAEAKGWKDA